MSTYTVTYLCSPEFEQRVYECALQQLQKFEFSSYMSHSCLRQERPLHWPMTVEHLQKPKGQHLKKFTGLTFQPREFLKNGIDPGLPRDLQFGLRVLSCWHREVWHGERTGRCKSFASYMRWFIKNWGAEPYLGQGTVDHAA